MPHRWRRRSGFVRSRVLWQMRRSLFAALPPARFPDGVRLRSFLPGLDDDEWLALNAAAFVDLPDQGGWTLDDLHVRMREPWFDAAGFLVAVEDGPQGERMVGFHWTKVHGADHHHGGDHDHDHEPGHSHGHSDDPQHTLGHGHEPIGEVYVVGVDPGPAAAASAARSPSPACPPAQRGPARRDALRRRQQHRRDPALPEPRLHPLGHRRRVHRRAVGHLSRTDPALPG